MITSDMHVSRKMNVDWQDSIDIVDCENVTWIATE